jgi:hypothetical protein
MNLRRLTTILITGDLVVLLIFVIIGRMSHDMTSTTIDSGIITGVTLIVPWLIVVFATQALPNGGVRQFMLKSLAAWLIAVPLGLIARALLLGANVISVPFMITTLTLGGAFVLGWRLLFAYIWLRRAPSAAATSQS